jgi:hypothetical protein
MPAKEQKRAERYSVFLNIPYDSAFENLYLAYIAGLSAFGLISRATPEIPTSQRRLERILKLLQRARLARPFWKWRCLQGLPPDLERLKCSR